MIRALFDVIKIEVNLYVMESERDPRPHKRPHSKEHSVNDVLWTCVMQQHGVHLLDRLSLRWQNSFINVYPVSSPVLGTYKN